MVRLSNARTFSLLFIFGLEKSVAMVKAYRPSSGHKKYNIFKNRIMEQQLIVYCSTRNSAWFRFSGLPLSDPRFSIRSLALLADFSRSRWRRSARTAPPTHPTLVVLPVCSYHFLTWKSSCNSVKGFGSSEGASLLGSRSDSTPVDFFLSVSVPYVFVQLARKYADLQNLLCVCRQTETNQ